MALTPVEMDALLENYLESQGAANQTRGITLQYGTDTFYLLKKDEFVVISKKCNGNEEIQKVLKDTDASIWRKACLYVSEQKKEKLDVGGTSVTPHQLFSGLLCKITQ